ncbi:MAG: type II toxin-antitoxin system HicB family antitoxin [Euryarchaeota archaeon]|nr:type II toxin-antitoxin system HicB family antitoxin [Euryarchaeota archaeon]
MKHVFTAVAHKEEKFYVAECPEVGTVSQGESVEEAIKNLQEATELYLEEFPISKTTKPFVSIFEVTPHAKTSKAIRT